jgi:hypothetical protein
MAVAGVKVPQGRKLTEDPVLTSKRMSRFYVKEAYGSRKFGGRLMIDDNEAYEASLYPGAIDGSALTW